jgi:hypothetical protein
MAVKQVPPILWLTLGVGLIFDSMCVACWVLFIFVDCSEGALAVTSAFAVFTGPLLAGTLLILFRRPAGMRWLRFGSVIFICEPGSLIEIWMLKNDPRYIAYMNGDPPVQVTEAPVTQPRLNPWHRGKAQGSPSD